MFLAPALALALAPSLSLPPNTKLVISAPRSYRGRGLRLCLSLRYRAETRQRCAVGDAAPNHNGNSNSKSNSSQGGGGGRGAASAISNPEYAPGTQKKVSGEVIRWRNDSGLEKIDAVKYIELLEGEIDELQQQLERGKASSGQNEILDYLKSLEPHNLQELTSSAGEDALDAMNTFIQRLLGVSDPAQLKRTPTETTAPELGRLLYWLMVVGYGIRNIEVRFDMERVLGMPSILHELPPGENL